MQCDTCGNDAVLFQPSSGRYLCSRHLVSDIETRAKRSIRSHRWMKTGDHIAVILTGDKKSAALLRFLQKLVSGRRDIRLSAVPAGDMEQGAHGPAAAERVAESLGISCIENRRNCRNSGHDDRVTRFALAFTLNDIAREVLVQFLSGNAEQLMHPLPPGSSMRPVICPFIAVPSVEADWYWDYEGTGIDLLPCGFARDPSTLHVDTLFRKYQLRHPATGHALLNLAEELSGCRVAEIADSAARRNGPVPASFTAGGD